jgi:hypothetical protein
MAGSPSGSWDGVGVTMTAELSDVFQTKGEGVAYIISCVGEAFGDSPLGIVDVEGSLISPEEAKLSPLRVASANWAATGWLVARYLSNGLVVDVGSTTTSIIPVLASKTAARGKTDLEKLGCGELVYTGALRTNVAAVVKSIPLGGGRVRVSSELFATTGDVHLILGNLKEEEYTVETSDGRGVTKSEASARLARVVCADLSMLGETEVEEIAQFVAGEQVNQIAEALNQVFEAAALPALDKNRIPVVTAGLGAEFLARKAALKAGFRQVVNLDELTGLAISKTAPAGAAALMAAERYGGGGGEV